MKILHEGYQIETVKLDTGKIDVSVTRPRFFGRKNQTFTTTTRIFDNHTQAVKFALEAINKGEINSVSIEDNSKKVKLRTRKEKIAAIEEELFKRCMSGETPTTELVEVFEALQATENEQELMALKEGNSFSGQFNQIAWTGVMVGAIATLGSFIFYQPCKESRSKFCSEVRVIPEALLRIFEEPKVKSKVLPLNLNQ